MKYLRGRNIIIFDKMSVNVRYEANGPKVPLVRVERPIPEPTNNGVIVKTHYAGICHTDVYSWHNSFRINNETSVTLQMVNPDFTYPCVFGHEISGEVYKIGKDVKNVKVGDRVCVYPWIGCDDCTHCNNDMNKRCYNKQIAIGMLADGGFQTHVTVPNSEYALPVASSVGLDMACMFGCSVITAFSAIQKIQPYVENAVKITGKAKVLLVAMGGVGLWGLILARAMLPKQTTIICADVSDEKLIAPKEHGSDKTVVWALSDSKEEIVTKTKAVSEGGVDAAIDFYGSSANIEKLMDCCLRGAAICVVGLAGGVAPVVLVNLVLKEIALLGTYVGTATQMKEAIAVIEKNKLKSPPFSAIPPEKLFDTILALDQGKVKGRSIVDFTK